MTVDIQPEAAPAYLRPLLGRLQTADSADLNRLRPPPASARQSAVLILFGGPDDRPDILLTERSATIRSHTGQVAFPGGSADPGDRGPIDTALREAEEEVGLDRADVRPLAVMPDLYIPFSGFGVTPVLGYAPGTYDAYARDPAEVARAERIAVADLVEPENRFTVRSPSGYVGSAFDVGGLFVWGFTAGVLDGVLSMGGFAKPWDTGRERALPKRFER